MARGCDTPAIAGGQERGFPNGAETSLIGTRMSRVLAFATDAALDDVGHGVRAPWCSAGLGCCRRKRRTDALNVFGASRLLSCSASGRKTSSDLGIRVEGFSDSSGGALIGLAVQQQRRDRDGGQHVAEVGCSERP